MLLGEAAFLRKAPPPDPLPESGGCAAGWAALWLLLGAAAEGTRCAVGGTPSRKAAGAPRRAVPWLLLGAAAEGTRCAVGGTPSRKAAGAPRRAVPWLLLGAAAEGTSSNTKKARRKHRSAPFSHPEYRPIRRSSGGDPGEGLLSEKPPPPTFHAPKPYARPSRRGGRRMPSGRRAGALFS